MSTDTAIEPAIDTNHANPPAIDGSKVDQFAHQLIADIGAAMSAVLVHIGDRLGLYRALADGDPSPRRRWPRRPG